MSRKRSSIIKYTLSFFLPAGILLSVMFLKGMWPFGDRSMLLWDMEIQYINIYNWYHDVLHGNAHIFYDFSKSLGGNMFGVFASYLASPLCLLTWFFSPEKMTHFIAISTLIKTALSGLAMSIYLNRRFDLKPDAFNILFSVS
ncbi:MAG: YfhO family protein, partial [Lachnospiraceae bacterium]|nr:YfhO family protein [Lachnospiraceae bacterium]